MEHSTFYRLFSEYMSNYYRYEISYKEQPELKSTQLLIPSLTGLKSFTVAQVVVSQDFSSYFSIFRDEMTIIF